MTNTAQIEITPEYLSSQGLSLSFPRRFWEKIQKTETCWLWTGAKGGKGYGMIWRGGENPPTIYINATRASWLLHRGPIPDGLDVCHDCRPNKDNPACVRPDHLWLGTVGQNMIDAHRKRDPNAERKITWVLSAGQVLTIRSLKEAGATTNEIAELFHIDPGHVRDVVNRRIWKHI